MLFLSKKSKGRKQLQHWNKRNARQKQMQHKLFEMMLTNKEQVARKIWMKHYLFSNKQTMQLRKSKRK